MAITFISKGKTINLDKDKISLSKALAELDLYPEMVLAVKNGELIEEDALLLDGDTIKLIAAISGG